MSDEQYIKLTFELAAKGLGSVSPNPLVGAVLVKDGKIIGKGFHEKFGEAHAEINAINSASEKSEGSTLYVNLEPCSHFGKTPPCVDEIIRQKISKVIIANRDPNPLVNGKGIKKLEAAGIKVKTGILEDEGTELNKFFFKNQTCKLPYVTVKIAQTLDGRIAGTDRSSKWITSEASRKIVHKMRSEYDAILVGKNTILSDNPSLNVRLVEGRNPVKIALDKNLEIPLTSKIFKNVSGSKTIIAASSKSFFQEDEQVKNYSGIAEIIFVKEDESGGLNILDVLEKLYSKGITSVIVEGGGKVFSSFINKNLYDEIYLFTGPKILGSGISSVNKNGFVNISDSINLKLKSIEQIDGDALLIYGRE